MSKIKIDANQRITIKGAREHNLKNVDLVLPRNKLIVMTGLSGSGKSSLAFDTIYADGQRRYMESLSSYARQFLGQMEKPDVDEITGLSPAISIDQKTTSHNPRSTVGTVTEIYDYLRLMYARIGVPHCPVCGRVISQQSVDEMVDEVLKLPERTRFQVLAPVVRARKGTQAKELDAARRAGYVRVRIDGNLYDLDEEIKLEKNIKHTVEVVVDRLTINDSVRSRLADSIETALNLTGGLVTIDVIGGEPMQFSQHYACPEHGISIDELTPRMFSFNNPFGACETCTGLGTFMKVDPARIIPDRRKSIRQGAIKASGWYYAEGSISEMYYLALGKRYGFTLDTPIREMSKEAVDALLHGTKGEKIEMQRENMFGSGSYMNEFEGIVTNLERRFRETSSEWVKEEIAQVMSSEECPTCHGRRLKPTSLAVTVGDLNIADFCDMSVNEELEYIRTTHVPERAQMIGASIFKEVRERLGFLQSVGLGYLTLSRGAASLSGGESQRIRLATQIGSALTGVLYVLDEPSIGLHQRDNDKLIATMKRLRDLGNTLIVVEHDEDTMRQADYLVDVGPGAGVHGGEIVAAGSVEDICKAKRSITGAYLSGRKAVEVPGHRREGNGKFLRVVGARENNLANITVDFPLGKFICVTGVSGSGKSTLVNEILYKTLAAAMNGARSRPGQCDEVEGMEWVDKVIGIDQSPIGRTPPLQPRHLYRRVHRHPHPVCRDPGRQNARLRAGAVQLQRQGRPLRSLRGRRHFADRDALSARHLCALRRLQGQTLQPRNAGGPLQGQDHRRRAGHDGGGSLRLFCQPAQDRPQAADPAGGGFGLYPAGPGGHHPVRRRGPAGQAGQRAGPPGHRADRLYPGRAYHRPACCRRAPAGQGAGQAGGRRQHRHCHRA